VLGNCAKGISIKVSHTVLPRSQQISWKAKAKVLRQSLSQIILGYIFVPIITYLQTECRNKPALVAEIRLSFCLLPQNRSDTVGEIKPPAGQTEIFWFPPKDALPND
jgi:hypothetical protein